MTPDPVGLPTAAPVPATTTIPPVALSWTGKGQQKTDKFHLPGGAYLVTWGFDGDCLYFTSIRLADGSIGGSHTLGEGDGPVKGDNNLYGVAPGDYYVDVNTGPSPNCPWTIVLAQAP